MSSHRGNLEVLHSFMALRQSCFICVTGKFQEEPDQPATRFLRVSNNMDGDLAMSESVKFDWPRFTHAFITNIMYKFKCFNCLTHRIFNLRRIVLKMNPTTVHSILERVTVEDDEGTEDHSLEEEEEEGAAHSLKDVCDFGKPEPSPFSSRRVMYENEEVGHGHGSLEVVVHFTSITDTYFTCSVFVPLRAS